VTFSVNENTYAYVMEAKDKEKEMVWIVCIVSIYPSNYICIGISTLEMIDQKVTPHK
jgi:hypothetical protein